LGKLTAFKRHTNSKKSEEKGAVRLSAVP